MDLKTLSFKVNEIYRKYAKVQQLFFGIFNGGKKFRLRFGALHLAYFRRQRFEVQFNIVQHKRMHTCEFFQNFSPGIYAKFPVRCPITLIHNTNVIIGFQPPIGIFGFATQYTNFLIFEVLEQYFTYNYKAFWIFYFMSTCQRKPIYLIIILLVPHRVSCPWRLWQWKMLSFLHGFYWLQL